MPGAGVTLEQVSRSFDGIRVLDRVSIELAPGEMVSLAGPSGSGKTTLLQLIGSLDRPTGGLIAVDGIEVGELRSPAGYRRNVVGFVFQLHYLLPGLTARQNVEIPLAALGIKRRERAERALAALAEVGLEAAASRPPSDLSGGERQRVAIARAMINRPRLLLADEPTGSLDTAASSRIWELLAESRQRHGTTILIASHDPTVTEHVDRTIHLRDGRIETPGTTPAVPAEGGG